MIKKLVAWLIGRKVIDATGQLDPFSKAKIVALLAIIMPTIQPIATALGHPIPPPILDIAYKVLAGAGLWAVRDALPPAPPTTPTI